MIAEIIIKQTLNHIAFNTTITEDNAMVADAIIGFRKIPGDYGAEALNPPDFSFKKI